MINNFNANGIDENIPQFSVSDLSIAIKRHIEGEFSHVKVKGEIGRVSKPTSGHLYLDLKDEKSVLSGIIWRGVAQNLTLQPEEGLEVVVTGRITTFPGQSRYQIIIDYLSPAGLGSLMLLLEKRKQQLTKEGVFLEENKKKLPFLPCTIGVITSSSGAVLKDILHRLKDRFPRNVLLWPVTVQGEKCASDIVEAIKGFNRVESNKVITKPDLLIVARGGGSIEDLWGFNEENVIRAVAQSRIPIISAIGHETDWTLIDYVADKRAPTPSAAAEMAVPVKIELQSALTSLDERRLRQVKNSLERQNSKIKELTRLMPKIESFVSDRYQYLDMMVGKMESAITKLITQKKLYYAQSGTDGFQPKILQKDLLRKKEQVHGLYERIVFSKKLMLSNCRKKLLELDRLLDSLSYRNTLERGYVIVRDEDHLVLGNSKEAKDAGNINIEFKDGKVGAKVSRKI